MTAAARAGERIAEALFQRRILASSQHHRAPQKPPPGFSPPSGIQLTSTSKLVYSTSTFTNNTVATVSEDC